MLSIPCEERYGAVDMTPQKFKDETLRALIDTTEAIARRQPIVELFEVCQRRHGTIPFLEIHSGPSRQPRGTIACFGNSGGKRRHFGLLCAPARSPVGEAARLGLHVRRYPEDPRPEA